MVVLTNGSKMVYCTVQFEATHNWPECPFDEVDYLRVEHRHVFWIRAYKEVLHNDRDVEFIILKHRIEEYLAKQYPDNKLGSTSCEMLAEELIKEFDLLCCDVSEDNENGAVVAAP